MIPADETFEDTWPFAPHFCDDRRLPPALRR